MARPISLAQVATRFGKSAKWLRANRDRLQREYSFPASIPGFGNIYDPLAIEAWLARQRAPAATVHVAAPSGEISPAAAEKDWSAILDQRAAALAPAAGHA